MLTLSSRVCLFSSFLVSVSYISVFFVVSTTIPINILGTKPSDLPFQTLSSRGQLGVSQAIQIYENSRSSKRRSIYMYESRALFTKYYLFPLPLWLVIQGTDRYKSTTSTHRTDAESCFVMYILHSILLNMVRFLLYLSTSFLHLKDANLATILLSSVQLKQLFDSSSES
jgi:hypothetical protein